MLSPRAPRCVLIRFKVSCTGRPTKPEAQILKVCGAWGLGCSGWEPRKHESAVQICSLLASAGRVISAVPQAIALALLRTLLISTNEQTTLNFPPYGES